MRLDADVDAGERRPLVRVEEEDVPGRDEREDGVRLGGVEEEHVRADGRRAGLGDAEARLRPLRSIRSA